MGRRRAGTTPTEVALPTRRRPLRSLSVPVLALALVAAACGGDDETRRDAAERLATSDDTTEPDPDDVAAGDSEAVTIVGENIMFDTTELTAAVGQELEITFDNRDNGVQHNFRVRDTPDGDAKTEITEGPVTQTLTVSFDQPGEVEYRCDVHPNQMTGTISVA